jgi:tape measure domain-containing protein
MATEIGSLFVSLTADVAPYIRGMQSADRVTAQAGAQIAKSVGVAERSVQRLRGSFQQPIRPYSIIAASRAFEHAGDRVSLLRGALLATTAVFGGFAAALSSNIILRYADSFTQLSNQIRTVARDSNDLTAQIQGISQVADDSRSSLAATATLYSRLSKASPTTNKDDVLNYVSTIQKALQLGGATAQEAASAAIQFSQALASNRLQGEELRAILETPLGNALAKGLGVTIGQLREMGAAGELTATRVLGALKKVGPGVAADFDRTIVTLDQALTVADNRITRYIGAVNESYGVTRTLATGIGFLTDNLETVGAAFGAFGLALAAVFTGRLASSGAAALTKPIVAFREESRRARDELAGMKAELEEMKKLRDAASLKAAVTGTQGVDNFVPKSVQKEQLRIEQQLAAADEKKLLLQEELRSAYQKAGTTGIQLTARQIALAEKQAQAEASVAENVKKQAELRRQLVAVPAVTEGAAGRAAVQKQIADVEKEILSTRERYQSVFQQTQRQIEAAAATQRKADNDHANALAREAQLRQQIRSIDSRQTTSAGMLATTGQGASFAKANKDRVKAEEELAKAIAATQRREEALTKATANLNQVTAGAIEKRTTLRSRLIEQFETQESLNDAMTRAQSIENNLKNANQGVAESYKSLGALTEERKRLAAELASVEATAAKQAEQIASRQITIANNVSAAQRQALADHAANLTKIRQLQKEIADNDARRSTLVGAARSGASGAQEIGANNRAYEVNQITKQVTAMDAAIRNAQKGIAEFANRLAVLNQVRAAVAAGFSSLVAFLGGPWGVAFAGATAAIGIIAAKMAEASARMQRFNAIVDEQVGKLSELGNIGAKKTQVELQMASLEKQIKDVNVEVDAAKLALDAMFRPRKNVLGFVTEDARKQAAGARAEFDRLVSSFRNGEISIDGFKAGLQRIRTSFPDFKGIGKDIENFGVQIGRGEKAVDSLKATLDRAREAYEKLFKGKQITPSEAYAPLAEAAEDAAKRRALVAEQEREMYLSTLNDIQRAYVNFFDQQIKKAEEAGITVDGTIRKSAEEVARVLTMNQYGITSAKQLYSVLGGVVNVTRGASANGLVDSLRLATMSAEQLQTKIGTLQEQLNVAKDDLSKSINIPTSISGALGKDGLAYLQQAQAAIKQLVVDQQAGTLAFDLFKQKLQAVGQQLIALGISQNVVDPFIADILTAITNLNNLGSTIDTVKGRLNSLQQASSSTGAALSSSFTSTPMPVPGGSVNVIKPVAGGGAPPISPSIIQQGVAAAAPAISGPITAELQRLGLTSDASAMRVENAVRTGPPSLSSIEGNTAGTRDAITATGDQTVSALNTGFMGTQAAIGEIGSVLATSGSGSGGSGSGGDQWTIALPSLGDQLTAEYEMRMGNLQQRMQGLQIELMEAQLKGNEALVASIQRQIQELQLVIAKAEFARPTRFNTPGWFNPAGPGAVGRGLLDLGTGKGKGGGGGFGGFGFATGGAFRVGGIGGRDSQMVSFKASPNETVKIETPAQRRKSEGGGKGDVIINMNAPVEERRRRARRQAAREIARAIDGVR